MHPINALLTLSSLNVILVTIERFSFTTKIFLAPDHFLRLHEVFQMLTLILATVLIPFFLLYQVSHKFETLKSEKGLIFVTIFIIGVYFYATGNGVHELGNFFFDQYCNAKKVLHGTVCGGMFFSDFYFGNGLYFVGAFFMNLALMLFERLRPSSTFAKKDLPLLIINSIFYALAIFAYAAFDRVLVGLVYSVVTLLVVISFFYTKKTKAVNLPVTYSLLISYTLATIASIIFRFK